MLKQIIREGIRVLKEPKYYMSLLCGSATLIFDLLLIRALSSVPQLTVGGVVTVAFLAAIIFNFSLQRLLVFKQDQGMSHSLSLFFLYWILGSVVNLVFVKIGIALLGSVYLSQVITSFLLSVLSFVVYRRFIFGSDRLLDRLPILKDPRVIAGALIFAIIFLVRCVLLIVLYVKVGDTSVVWGDSMRYLGNAESFLENGSFSFRGALEVYRTPGYPMLLVPFLFFKIPMFGIALVQAFWSSLIPVFIYLLSLRLGLRPKWAIAASIFAGLEPMMLYYSIPLLPDTVFTIFLFLCCGLLYKYAENKDIRYVAGAGVLLGILNYVRQVGVYLVFLLGLYILLDAFVSRSKIRTALLHAALLILLVIVIASPWYYRNYKNFGVASFSSALPVNFFNYVGVGTLAAEQGRSYEPVRLELMEKFRAEAPYPEEQKDLRNQKYLMEETTRVVRQYPLSYAKTVLAGLNTLFFSGNYHYLLFKFGFIDPPKQFTSYSLVWASGGLSGLLSKVASDISSPYVLIAVLGKLFWVVMVALSVIGFWILRRRRESHLFMALMLYFSVTILSVGIGVEARHRYPLNPLILAFGFVTINRIYEKHISRRTAL